MYFHVSIIMFIQSGENHKYIIKIDTKNNNHFLDSVLVDTRHVVLCHGHQVSLRCPENAVLVIERANYGRQNSETCGQQELIECVTPETMVDLNVRCFGRRNCTVVVQPEMFPSARYQCHHKAERLYLEATYACVTGGV